MGPTEMSASVGEKGRLSSDCILCKLPLRLPGVEDLKKKIKYVLKASAHMNYVHKLYHGTLILVQYYHAIGLAKNFVEKVTNSTVKFGSKSTKCSPFFSNIRAYFTTSKELRSTQYYRLPFWTLFQQTAFQKMPTF